MGSHRVCAAAVSIDGCPAIDDNLRHRRYGALSRFPSWSGVIALSSAARLIRRSRISGRALTLASAALSFSAIAFGVPAVRARPVFHDHPYGQNPSEQCPENHQRFDCFCQPQAHRPSPKPQLTPTKQQLNAAWAAAAQSEHDPDARPSAPWCTHCAGRCLGFFDHTGCEKSSLIRRRLTCS